MKNCRAAAGEVVTAPIKPRIREDLTTVELDGEAVIYDDRTGDLHHLNSTATIVAKLCDGSATIRELAIDIAYAFQLPEDDVEKQIRSLLRKLRRADLLVDRSDQAHG
ncbi:MAG TPA: HPr-rel-A system PqqD family peptide chaperone [Actinomycetota bacterium]|jgi:PqqD family protein of HPr-rel-A system|nr:HPr-rel-A system PqqD family peptide chaperone [Actinomycetota bacterium]